MSRRAFTLIELLVVIAIIAVLIGLLLPAVQKVREASNRAKCANSLKQLGIAFHNYQTARQAFPPGYIANNSTWDGQADGSEATWVYFILPYIEQGSLFDRVDYNWVRTNNGFGTTNTQTDEIKRTRISLMVCQSDNPGANLVAGVRARGNYVANGGIGPLTFSASGKPPDHTVQGVFYLVSRTRVMDVVDGLSSTAFLTEVVTPEGDDLRGSMYYPEGPIYQHNYTPNSGIDEIRAGRCEDTAQAPCTTPYTAHNNRRLIITSRSRHPNGANLLMGDGAVRFAPNAVSSNVWRALSTPAGAAGEVAVTDF